MGAASSIASEDLPDNIRETLEMCEKQKFAIADYDNAMFNKEMEKVFKKHGKIIATLTSRTKAQLRKANHMKKSSPDEIFKLLGGNHYAKFMKFLYMSRQELEVEAVRTSSKPDYDEELLIQIVGTSSLKELTLFQEMYQIERKQTLMETFSEKAKKNAPLLKLMNMLLNRKRTESRSVDQELAISQAAQMHEAGAARLKGVDEDVIFGILLGNSRAQLAAVADSYLSQFHMKFERAINMKFKGSCARLILLLSMPLQHAVASCIHTLDDRFLIDKVAIMTMIAKFDKDFLQQVDLASEKMYEKNLVTLAGRGLSGNLYNAVQGWIENPSPDKGYERILEMFLEGKLMGGHDLRMLINEEDFQQRVIFLLTRQNEELTKYLKANRIRFNPNDAFQLNLMESFDSMKHKAVEDAQRDIMAKYSRKRSTKEVDEKYDEKQRKVMEYLKKYFQRNDPNTTGIFREDYFWDLLQKLPHEQLGFTSQEIPSMKAWTEWSVDGNVQYFEVLFELCDMVINAIESKPAGSNDVFKVISEVIEDPSMKRLAKTERRLSNSMNLFSAVPEYFLQMLYDTFAAFDFDENKFLCAPELTSLLGVLNISELTLDHFLKDPGDSITHKAAVEVVSKIVNPWFMTRTEDHYICLIDKDTGLYFWFNTLDESSQWADTGDYEGFDYNYLEYSPSTRPAQAFSTKSGIAELADGQDLAESAKKALNVVTEGDDEVFGSDERKSDSVADQVVQKPKKTPSGDAQQDDVDTANASGAAEEKTAETKESDDTDGSKERLAAAVEAESEGKQGKADLKHPVKICLSEEKDSQVAESEVDETKSAESQKVSEVPLPPAAEASADDAAPKASPRAPETSDVGGREEDVPIGSSSGKDTVEKDITQPTTDAAASTDTVEDDSRKGGETTGRPKIELPLSGTSVEAEKSAESTQSANA